MVCQRTFDRLRCRLGHARRTQKVIVDTGAGCTVSRETPAPSATLVTPPCKARGDPTAGACSFARTSPGGACAVQNRSSRQIVAPAPALVAGRPIYRADTVSPGAQPRQWGRCSRAPAVCTPSVSSWVQAKAYRSNLSRSHGSRIPAAVSEAVPRRRAVRFQACGCTPPFPLSTRAVPARPPHSYGRTAVGTTSQDPRRPRRRSERGMTRVGDGVSIVGNTLI